MVIIQKRVGQLCNQLFNIAHFAASAIEHDFKVVCPCFEFPLTTFPNLNNNAKLRVIQSSDRINLIIHRSFKLLRVCVRRSPWHACYQADGLPFMDLGCDEFITDAKKKIVACEGFSFRDNKSVIKHQPYLNELFRPSSEIEKRVDNFIKSHRLKDNSTLVGFHVRRGDYRTYRNGEYFYNNEAWRRWIDQVRSIIASNSKRFVGVILSNEDIGPLIGSDTDLFPGLGGMFEDLVMLSKCDYIVGPPSTFSGFASFSGRVPLLHLEKANAKIDLNHFKITEW